MRLLRNDTMEMLQFPALAGCRNISHFITTRRGGVSEGNYGSMNPAAYTNDSPANVKENLRRLSRFIQLPANRIIVPHQTHESNVCILDKSMLTVRPSERKAYLEGIDAIITDVPRVCIAVATADCVPLLLYAPDKQVVAVVHAGWRGTVQQLAAKTVQMMVQFYGCNPLVMMAGIGPSISRKAFEVGDDVVRAFLEADFPMRMVCFRNRLTGKAHIDLWEANRYLLLKSGLIGAHVEISNLCTYYNNDYFFSARRLGVESGRILSGIFLQETK